MESHWLENPPTGTRALRDVHGVKVVDPSEPLVARGTTLVPSFSSLRTSFVNLAEGYTVDEACHFVQVKVSREGFEPLHVDPCKSVV